MATDDAAAIRDERHAFADALEAVGPDAPTLAGSWTSHDVAAHVVSLDRFGGFPTFLGRTVVAGLALRVNDVAGRFADGSIRRVRRRGFSWALARLREPPPALLVRPSVAAVGLFEIVVHHEDVRRANEMPPVAGAPDALAPVVDWLLRYQRTRLRDIALRVVTEGVDSAIGSGPEVVLRGRPRDVVLWLAGRRDAADVDLDGEDAAVARIAAAWLYV
ncbi:MAG TPA: maleylpyruvate isomerase family mycothiol-dependent enzyme [Acidimicrobiales bacterium]